MSGVQGSGVPAEEATQARRLQAMGTLSAALAHEINNLLTPILGYSSMALADSADAKLMRTALERTHGAAERAVRVCDAVMGLARGPACETGHGDTPLAPVIAETAALLGWTAPGSDTRFTVDLQPGDLAAGMARTGIEQTLLNLFQNARRAMGPGGAVSVTARAHPATGAPQLTVRDTGPGVPPDKAATLFDAFVTAPPAPDAGARPRTGPRTGLGLWVSRTLLESAGGGLELAPHDPENPGACFRLLLPAPASGGASRSQAA